MVVALVLVLYISVWIAAVHRRAHQNLRRAHYYWRLAEEKLTIAPHHYVKPENQAPPLLRDWSHGFQISITVLLALVVLILVWLRATSPSHASVPC